MFGCGGSNAFFKSRNWYLMISLFPVNLLVKYCISCPMADLKYLFIHLFLLSQAVSIILTQFLWIMTLFMPLDCRDYSGYGLSQWEKMLQCDITYWLSPYLKWSLHWISLTCLMHMISLWLRLMFIAYNCFKACIDTLKSCISCNENC